MLLSSFCTQAKHRLFVSVLSHPSCRIRKKKLKKQAEFLIQCRLQHVFICLLFFNLNHITVPTS